MDVVASEKFHLENNGEAFGSNNINIRYRRRFFSPFTAAVTGFLFPSIIEGGKREKAFFFLSFPFHFVWPTKCTNERRLSTY